MTSIKENQNRRQAQWKMTQIAGNSWKLLEISKTCFLKFVVMHVERKEKLVSTKICSSKAQIWKSAVKVNSSSAGKPKPKGS